MTSSIPDSAPLLSDCPFCGAKAGEGEGPEPRVNELGRHFVFCFGCGASGPENAFFQTEAIPAWNRRAPGASLSPTDEVELSRELAEMKRHNLEVATLIIDNDRKATVQWAQGIHATLTADGCLVSTGDTSLSPESRAAFEAWAKSGRLNLRRMKANTNTYLALGTAQAWEAWQAASANQARDES